MFPIARTRGHSVYVWKTKQKKIFRKNNEILYNNNSFTIQFWSIWTVIAIYLCAHTDGKRCDDRPIVVDHTAWMMCNNIKQPLSDANFSWIDTHVLRRTWGFLILYATNTLFKNEKSIPIIYLHYSQCVSHCPRWPNTSIISCTHTYFCLSFLPLLDE